MDISVENLCEDTIGRVVIKSRGSGKIPGY